MMVLRLINRKACSIFLILSEGGPLFPGRSPTASFYTSLSLFQTLSTECTLVHTSFVDVRDISYITLDILFELANYLQVMRRPLQM